VGTRLWRKDLAWGERWERVIGLYLFFNGVSNITYNNDNRYDIKGVYKSNVTKFEIKSDRYKNTGNMALEIKDNDKPSGISVSEADVFVYNYTNISDIYVYIFFIPLVELKKVLRDNQSKLKIIKGGDDKEASIILLPMAEYKKYFKVVKLPKVEWYM
jgi:penicillin-binding protein-related factor A (putative recombinase)